MLIALALSTLLNVLYLMKTVITLYRPAREGFTPPAAQKSPLSVWAMAGFVAVNVLVGILADPIMQAIRIGLVMFD